MSGHLDLIARERAVLLFIEPRKDPMFFAGQPAVEFVGLRQMAIASAPGTFRGPGQSYTDAGLECAVNDPLPREFWNAVTQVAA